MKLFLNHELQEYWRSRDPFAAAFSLEGETVRRVKNRRTMRVRINGRSYFIKLHTSTDWREIIKNLTMFKTPVLGAENEYQAIKTLNRLGIPTTPVCGFGKRGWKPFRQESFIITRDLGNLKTVEDIADNWTSAPPSFEFKLNLIKKIAQISRTIHQHGMNHRDFYICHFLAGGTDRCSEHIPEDNPELFLIDLHRAQIRSGTPHRWRVKDIAGIWFSAMGAGLSRNDLFRFVKIYTGTSLKNGLNKHRRFWRDVQRQAERLKRKQERQRNRPSSPEFPETCPETDSEKSGNLTVGIPRALLYHLHPGLWETFFRELGMNVRLSSETTAETLQKASLISEPEHCLPVKLFDAHVAELAEKVDAVFVPLILSTRKGHIACPKLGALPDSIRADFGSRTEVMTVEIDERRTPLAKSLRALAGKLGKPPGAARAAADKALATMAEFEKTETVTGERPGEMRFLLLSHPYNLRTRYFVEPIIEKLAAMNGRVESVDYSRIPDKNGPVKWDMSSIMYDTLRELAPQSWAGVIQLTSFNCGCDSIVSNIFHDTLRQKNIPLLSLVLDEHTAQAGVDTRLEAFVDSIKARGED